MTKVRTAARKKKENTLRAIIDKQKKAAPTARNDIKELDLSTAGADITSLDKEQTKSTILFFKEELLAGIREGIDTELKSLDSETRERLEASGLIKEIYAGLKSGVTDELKKYIDVTNKSLVTSFDSIVDTLASSIESISQPPVVQTMPGEKETAIAPLDRKQKEQRPISIEALAREEQEKISTKFIGREELTGQEPTTRGGKIRNFLERATLGAVGLEGYAEKRIQKRQSLDYQVEIETKLNQKRFEGMTQKEIRKTVEKEQLQQEEIQKKLSKNEAQVSQLRRAGYSEDDIEKVGLNIERENILKEAVSSDPTRLGKEYSALSLAQSQSSDTTTTETNKKTLDEQSSKTESLLREEQTSTNSKKTTDEQSSKTKTILVDEKTRKQTDILSKEKSEKETLVGAEISQRTIKDYVANSSSTSVSEESQYEQTLKEEKLVKKQEEQVILLSEIREILREAEKVRAEKQTAAAATTGAGGAPLPEIDIDINRGPKPSRAPTPKSAKPSVAQRLGSVIRGPAGVFAAKAAAVGAAGYAGYKTGEWLNENVINPGISKLTGGEDTTLGGAIYSGVDKLQDMAGGWLGKSDKMKMREAEEAAKIERQKQKAAEKTINVKEGATPPRTGDRLATKMTDEKAEEQRPIIVNAPPPTVINGGGQAAAPVAPPFTTGIRNNEPSISDYLRSRYA